MVRPEIAPLTTTQDSGPDASQEKLDTLRRENVVLREALAVRKVIELAKALLMVRDGLSEAAAHRYIQKSSMDRRVPMVEVARALIPAAATRPGRVTTAEVRRTPWAAPAAKPDAPWASTRRWTRTSAPDHVTRADSSQASGLPATWPRRARRSANGQAPTRLT